MQAIECALHEKSEFGQSFQNLFLTMAYGRISTISSVESLESLDLI